MSEEEVADTFDDDASAVVGEKENASSTASSSKTEVISRSALKKAARSNRRVSFSSSALTRIFLKEDGDGAPRKPVKRRSSGVRRSLSGAAIGAEAALPRHGDATEFVSEVMDSDEQHSVEAESAESESVEASKEARSPRRRRRSSIAQLPRAAFEDASAAQEPVLPPSPGRASAAALNRTQVASVSMEMTGGIAQMLANKGGADDGEESMELTGEISLDPAEFERQLRNLNINDTPAPAAPATTAMPSGSMAEDATMESMDFVEEQDFLLEPNPAAAAVAAAAEEDATGNTGTYLEEAAGDTEHIGRNVYLDLGWDAEVRLRGRKSVAMVPASPLASTPQPARTRPPRKSIAMDLVNSMEISNNTSTSISTDTVAAPSEASARGRGRLGRKSVAMDLDLDVSDSDVPAPATTSPAAVRARAPRKSVAMDLVEDSPPVAARTRAARKSIAMDFDVGDADGTGKLPYASNVMETSSSAPPSPSPSRRRSVVADLDSAPPARSQSPKAKASSPRRRPRLSARKSIAMDLDSSPAPSKRASPDSSSAAADEDDGGGADIIAAAVKRMRTSLSGRKSLAMVLDMPPSPQQQEARSEPAAASSRRASESRRQSVAMNLTDTSISSSSVHQESVATPPSAGAKRRLSRRRSSLSAALAEGAAAEIAAGTAGQKSIDLARLFTKILADDDALPELLTSSMECSMNVSAHRALDATSVLDDEDPAVEDEALLREEVLEIAHERRAERSRKLSMAHSNPADRADEHDADSAAQQLMDLAVAPDALAERMESHYLAGPEVELHQWAVSSLRAAVKTLQADGKAMRAALVAEHGARPDVPTAVAAQLTEQSTLEAQISWIEWDTKLQRMIGHRLGESLAVLQRGRDYVQHLEQRARPEPAAPLTAEELGTAAELQDLFEVASGLQMWRATHLAPDKLAFEFRVRPPLHPRTLHVTLDAGATVAHHGVERRLVADAQFLTTEPGRAIEDPFAVGLLRTTNVAGILAGMAHAGQLRPALEELGFRLMRVEQLLREVARLRERYDVTTDGAGSGSLTATFVDAACTCKFAVVFERLSYGYPFGAMQWRVVPIYGTVPLDALTQTVRDADAPGFGRLSSILQRVAASSS